jgi:hypothetical protein
VATVAKMANAFFMCISSIACQGDNANRFRWLLGNRGFLPRFAQQNSRLRTQI